MTLSDASFGAACTVVIALFQLINNLAICRVRVQTENLAMVGAGQHAQNQAAIHAVVSSVNGQITEMHNEMTQTILATKSPQPFAQSEPEVRP